MLAEQSRGNFSVVRENKEKNKEEGKNDITKHVRVFVSEILHRNGKLNRSQWFIWKNSNHKTKRKEKNTKNLHNPKQMLSVEHITIPDFYLEYCN